jgi:hypothetical protein
MHWHKLDKSGKTLDMTANPLRILFWRFRGYGVRYCRLPYSWFDRKAHKWRGARHSNPDIGYCINAN